MPDSDRDGMLDGRRAVVLVVDRFSPHYLSPYGNTWTITPACNQLAASGILFEHAVANSTQIAAIYDAMLRGCELAGTPPHKRSLLAVFNEQRLFSQLVTDSPEVARLQICSQFAEADLLEIEPSQGAATRIDETAMGRFFAAATDRLLNSSAHLTWLHCRGMSQAWDAPFALREQFAHEDDPPPPTELQPPQGELPQDADPDLLQGWAWAYAGQTLVFDHLLHQLVHVCQQHPDPTLLVVLGARGVSLGEHGFWSTQDCATADVETETTSSPLPSHTLFSQLTHIPLLIALNDAAKNHDDLPRIDGSSRSQTLVQHHHLYDTLCAWFQLPRDARRPERPEQNLLAIPQSELQVNGVASTELAVCRSAQQLHLRTPKWAGLFQDDLQACQLYLKPDDRWDFNDVADRCPRVVEAFRQLKARIDAGLGSGEIFELSPIDERLLTAPD